MEETEFPSIGSLPSYLKWSRPKAESQELNPDFLENVKKLVSWAITVVYQGLKL